MALDRVGSSRLYMGGRCSFIQQGVMTDLQLIYLLLLLILILSLGGWRKIFGGPSSQTVRNLALWLGLATGLGLVYTLLYPNDDFGAPLVADISRSTHSVDRSTLPKGPGEARIHANRDGHYRVVARVNGIPVNFIVDTGATAVVLGPSDARRIGIDPTRLTYAGRTMTANGEIRTARARLDTMVIGDLALTDVEAIITPSEMGMSLLGLSFLNRLRSFSFADGTLVLKN